MCHPTLYRVRLYCRLAIANLLPWAQMTASTTLQCYAHSLLVPWGPATPVAAAWPLSGPSANSACDACATHGVTCLPRRHVTHVPLTAQSHRQSRLPEGKVEPGRPLHVPSLIAVPVALAEATTWACGWAV